MSASDPNGYFVELGEYNLIIARITLGQRPRTIEAIQEVWLGDAAATETALGEVRPNGVSGKAVALLRLKARSVLLADANQAKSVASPEAVEGFLKTALSADSLPANWAWCGASNGLAPQNGARWVIDATPTANTEEALGKLRNWSFELVRCQSASLSLVGGLSSAATGAPLLLLEVSENNTSLISISSQGIAALATVPVGFDALAGATQTALGLKFRGSAARLMFNESYDFSESAASIVEPLANAIRGALPGLGGPAPTQLACGGILARQAWINQALAKALGMTSFTVDAAAWAGAHGLAFGSAVNASGIAPSWLGVLGAAAAYESASPGATKAWNLLLSGTPVATAPAAPVVIAEPVKQATPPPAVKPAIVPAIIQEPAKPVAPAPKPVVPPKPAVIITPPSKPVEPVKPATPPPTVAKPAEVKPAAPAPAKPVPAPAPAKPAPAPVTKAPAKPEPAKPAPIVKPAPAPVVAAKSATAAPFPPKRNNMGLIIGAAAAVIIGLVVFFVIKSNNQEKADQAEKERIRVEAEAKIKAETRARAEAEQKAKEAREAREKELEQAAKLLKDAQDKARLQAQKDLNSRLYGRGNFAIATEPAGAAITVGPIGPKPSPLTLSDLNLGTYEVTVSLPGYDTEHYNIEIKEKETTDLGTIVLKRQVGSIELTSDPSNLPYEIKPAGSLFVNPSEIRTGQTPATLTGIPSGTYQVTISRPNWQPSVSTVTVERNGTAKVNGDFPGGTVIINSTPSGATVMRDGMIAVGNTPVTLNGIQPGNLSFTINGRGYDPVTVTGKMEGGKTLTLNATLRDTDRLMKLSELDERPSPISQADPDLSTSQRLEGGSALISLVVGRDGMPTDLKIEQESNPGFGKTCLIAASKWRFKPGMVNGKPARSRVSIPFRIGPE